MASLDETDLRRRSVHLRGLADIRAVTVTDGQGCGGRLLEVRTPTGLSFDIALDRGGDIARLAFRGHEIGWHSATGMPAPWPVADTEAGLGFLRGLDGFLVTCGLDHHGVATRTDAGDFLYPLRRQAHHPLHGRIMAARAEVLEKRMDWQGRAIRIHMLMRQTSVFGENLELSRIVTASLTEPKICLADRVTNRGFRPVRHGILYHVNLGYPMLDAASTLTGADWPLAALLDQTPARPCDTHIEQVDAAPSPPAGRIGLFNPDLGLHLGIAFDPVALPVTAVWRAFQSGTFALGLEPQTRLDDDETATLAAGGTRDHALTFTLGIE